ncbi:MULTISPECIES: DNA polymerase III subunit psi [Gallibacterium]|uniref:DNA polymerase III subunit psi n=1 Tax=Gallibacterium genomosp. 1 TaxID=155515 RepID=A0A0A2Y2I1_9PAST|nr:DNA polymerase III subunit psi [Gallibacterium genomosp. 1]KGQ38871.1 DNA polymerase III subunit psi [Gallibacterium genomosp. 1]OBX00682.1 DNA polymerase III subunit psi [Gallibacterium genomosp. 1]OBX01669.1 DNA polymerase III subunit psi [Gallibacterium genomosp. 1]
MINRRELLLQEMGITFWQLVHPEVLQGVGIINVPADIHTIILSEQHSIIGSQLIQDLLRAAETTTDKALIINCQQLQRLESDHPLLVFCVEDCLSQFQNSALAKIATQIISLNSTLILSVQQKRTIWQQIQHFLQNENTISNHH